LTRAAAQRERAIVPTKVRRKRRFMKYGY